MALSPCLRILSLAGVLFLAAGCATTGSSTSGSSRNTLGEAELAEHSGVTAYEVVQRLRPTWLQRRGGSPEVLVDGVRRGGTDVLRQIAVEEVREIRYLAPRDATTRYGTGFPYGAIEVDSKR